MLLSLATSRNHSVLPHTSLSCLAYHTCYPFCVTYTAHEVHSAKPCL